MRNIKNGGNPIKTHENVSYFLSEGIWQELIAALQKPRIAKRLKGFEKPVSDFLKWYHKQAINVFLETAFCVEADYLISYDEDLLILKKIGSTKIVEPKEFCQTISIHACPEE